MKNEQRSGWLAFLALVLVGVPTACGGVVGEGEGDGDGGPDTDVVGDVGDDDVRDVRDTDVRDVREGDIGEEDGDAVCECSADPDCDDGEPCNGEERCSDCACLPGIPAGDGTACDDGDPCTGDDACTGGICAGGTSTCECTVDPECAAYEDGDACNGTLHCEAGFCVEAPATVVVCDPSGDTPCQANRCDPATGLCTLEPRADGTTCDDRDACTTGDACASGSCTGGARTCHDGNACTTDSCNPATGCVFTNNTTPCEDGNPCTTPDRCAGGTCVAGPGLPVWYRDADDDNFGDPASTPVCAASEPSGYTDNNDDCCDSNANVRPDQTSYFASSYLCGSGGAPSFDYNCNGVAERRWTATGGGCRWIVTTCEETIGWQGGGGSAPACGVTGTWVTGCDGSCRVIGESRAQSCR